MDQVEVADKLQAQFVTQQLCSMLAVLDLTDEVGRSVLVLLAVAIGVAIVVGVVDSCCWCVQVPVV